MRSSMYVKLLFGHYGEDADCIFKLVDQLQRGLHQPANVNQSQHPNTLPINGDRARSPDPRGKAFHQAFHYDLQFHRSNTVKTQISKGSAAQTQTEWATCSSITETVGVAMVSPFRLETGSCCWEIFHQTRSVCAPRRL